MMIRSFVFLLVTLLLISPSERQPLKADFNNSAAYRWLNKEVIDHRPLDDMESTQHWIAFTKGAQQVVDARVDTREKEEELKIARLSLSSEIKFEGSKSLCFKIPTKLDVPGPKSGRGWGTAGVRRIFDGEDWTESNRISLRIYPDCPGFYVNWLELRIYNEGLEKLPALFGQEGETSLLLRNNEWNHVVWEFGNVARDKVTSLEISYYLSGNEPEASDTATYYIDQLELQKVEPDHIEGWDVWPGRIAYSHTGYQSGANKTAIASGLDAREFKVIDQQTGETVLKKPMQVKESHLGKYQVMDFTEIHKPGKYILEADKVRTRSFRIELNVWRETILKALNFFYVERCGMTIPGVHGICHRDWRCIHEDKQIIINGGWHDAGDLTQGLGNTAETVYAMFSLAERLKLSNTDPELYAMLLDEAQWGLDWILKTSFRDGYRNGGSVSSRRTNGIIGDFDDVISTARNSPMDHFVSASAEAIGYRLLKDDHIRLADLSLIMAEEDWKFAVDELDVQKVQKEKSYFRGTFDSDNVEHEIASVGILASVELWKSTQDPQYKDKAAEWAEIIVNSQQREKPDWDIPINGFFYTNPDKEHILHYVHRGREQAPIIALTQLCETFPDHPNWMTWYAAVALHTEYLKTISNYTEPFRVFPASIYSDEEYLLAPESRRESFRKQALNGIPLGSGKFLRLFPVWMDYRGHFGTILPQAKALVSASHLRGDLSTVQLAQHQLEWVVGRNPFSQSSMWGEGYDFPNLYTPLSGDIVGGLPVGIQTRNEHDVPYWPVQNSWTYKEIWGYPVTNWISLMTDISGPALIEGWADSVVEFVSLGNGQVISVNPNLLTKRFKVSLPEGAYKIRSGGLDQKRTFLPAENYALDMRHDRIIEFEISQNTSAKGEVKITVKASGNGVHEFALRTDNLLIRSPIQQLKLRRGVLETLEWQGRIPKDKEPWIAVIIPDGNLGQRKEVMGNN